MESTERIKAILLHLGKDEKTLADDIKISVDTIYNIQKGHRITPKTGNKILSAYKEFRPSWVLDGIGDMLLTPEEIELKERQEEKQISSCLLCAEKERYIKMLEERIEEQKKTIETYRKCIEALRSEEDLKKIPASG